ncbi:MAG: ATP-dependent DNA helicase RecG [Ignavibacteriae bacterium]|nr:MAG: ATP-dependent DNA helicase RecG [Ignavibacteriota bacterium]
MILPLQYVKGVGPKRAEALANEGVVTARDVLLRVPRAYIDRSAAPSIAVLYNRLRSPDLWKGDALSITAVSTDVSLVATVTSAPERTVGRARKMFTATVSDGSGASAQLIFWNAINYFSRIIKVGDTVAISGIPEYDPRWNQLTFTHPEVERVDEEDIERYRQGAILAKYPMTQALRNAGITMRLMRHIVEHVIDDAIADERDVLPPDIIQRHDLMERRAALRELHLPTSIKSIDRARARLKFEELFFFQLFLAARSRSRKRPDRGLSLDPRSPRARALVEQLPFELTTAQRRVIHEIIHDMSSGAPMNRLLQGDVGSGKTIVAMLCMLNAIDNGYQAVLMAPTEILAEQHFRTISKWLEGTGVVVDQLVGGQRSKARKEVASRIAAGESHIIVGTHALFEAEVQYHKLGLIVIDEQHRFGVAQRAELKRLGRLSHEDDPRNPHILVMSATPIPRTLSMTLYGDLDVSVIDELPKDRTPIRTRVVFESGLTQVYDFIRDEIAKGRQAYIVYPLVEKSEKLELKSAVEHHEFLASSVFPDLRIGLLHGQMLWYEKEDAMKAFLNKEFDVLVSTTVIEVGVDVPNATVMLIENAERFGLSQLHQLRGRVGRSGHQSYCFLATKDHFRFQMSRANSAEERAKAAVRLKTMEETTDGFRIAEVDLKLRGPGDLMGTRQSGVPEFMFADLVTDGPVITQARAEAFALLEHDPTLRAPEHQALRERLVDDATSSGFLTVA